MSFGRAYVEPCDRDRSKQASTRRRIRVQRFLRVSHDRHLCGMCIAKVFQVKRFTRQEM